MLAYNKCVVENVAIYVDFEGVFAGVCSKYVKGWCVWGMSAHFVSEGYPERTLLNPFVWHNPVGLFITDLAHINMTCRMYINTAQFSGCGDRHAWLLSEYTEPLWDSLSTTYK